MKKLKVYLAGQWNEQDNDWKKSFKKIKGLEFYDPETDSNQESPDTFFPDDLCGLKNADIMVANPGIAPGEGTWIELGFFYATHIDKIGKLCKNLIIVWKKDRLPKWSFDFVNKTGIVVKTVAEAKKQLIKIIKD